MMFQPSIFEVMHDFLTEMFRQEVLMTLSQKPKKPPPKFFYDEIGCQLFDQICRTDEYYPTRTEIGILTSNIKTISDKLCRIVY